MEAAKHPPEETRSFNAALPPSYASRIPAEEEVGLRHILDGLRLANASGDVDHGAHFYVASLSRFLALKHALPDESRAELIGLIFGLISLPDLRRSRRSACCALLVALLRRAKHLELELPWRPLFGLAMRHFLPPLQPLQHEGRHLLRVHGHELVRCIGACRRHFAEDAATEMIEAIEPLLCPHEPTHFAFGAGMLALMVPTHGSAAARWLPRVRELWLSSGHEGSSDWDSLWVRLLERLCKDEFFGRADAVDWAPLLPAIYSRTLLLLRLPGGRESREELRPSSCRLPSKILSALHHTSPIEVMRSAARLIVLTLPPCGGAVEPLPVELLEGGIEADAWSERIAQTEEVEESAAVAAAQGVSGGGDAQGAHAALHWSRLRQLLRCVSPCCHPSNSGSYCNEIGGLLQGLCHYTWWRVLFEEKGEAKGGRPLLGASDLHRLTRALVPLLAQARYAKHFPLPRFADQGFRYLAALVPELTLPALSFRVSQGLQALTAVHQTNVALHTLAMVTPVMLGLCPVSGVAPPLGHRPSHAALATLAAGPRAMRSLLELALPGIDANDPTKLFLTLNAFDVVLALIPLSGDAWRADDQPVLVAADEQAPARYGVFARQALRERLVGELQGRAAAEEAEGGAEGIASAHEVVCALDEQSSEAAALASWLPQFAEQLLGRMLAVLEHLEKVPKKRAGQHRLQLAKWRLTATLFWQQLSQKVFDTCLPELLRLIPRSSLLDAAKHLGAHLAAATLAQPARTLRLAVPAFCSLLLRPKVAGSPRALRPLSEPELLWMVPLLAQTVRHGGADLLEHWAELTDVLNVLRAHESLAVAKAAYKLRRRLLQSLLSTYTTDLRSLPPAAWHHPRVREAPWECWGWVPPRKAPEGGVGGVLELGWHVPSAPEVAAARTLIDETLERAEALLSSSAPEEPAVRRVLLELRALAKGAIPFASDSEEAAARVIQSVRMPANNGEGTTLELEEGADTACDGEPMELVEEMIEAAAAIIPTDNSTDLEDVVMSRSLSPSDDSRSVPPELRSPIGRALPELTEVVGSAGCVPMGQMRARFARLLSALGTRLTPAEGTKALKQLLKVVRMVLFERSSRIFADQHQLCAMLRQSTELRGGGMHKLRPRAAFALQLQARHSDRLAAAARGAAWRCRELGPLIELQLQLSTHRYSSVRKAAQEGYATSLGLHPWLARSQLPALIANVRESRAEPHECKGSTFLLANPTLLQLIGSDWGLLCAALSALCHAPEHELPKIHQRRRALLGEIIGVHRAPPVTRAMLDGPFCASPSSGAPPPPSDARQAALHALCARATARNQRARRHCLEQILPLLRVASAELRPDASDQVREQQQQHWSREESCLCALLLVPPTTAAERQATAAAAARRLVSENQALRKLSRCVLTVMLAAENNARGDDVDVFQFPPTLRPAAAPASLWDALPEDDAAWSATIGLADHSGCGWGAGQQYLSKAEADVEQLRLAGAGGPLGAEADALLLSEQSLELILQWIVVDHKEADDSGESRMSMLKEALEPHQYLVSSLRAGRSWPLTLSHGLKGTNFSLATAQLLKGLASHYGPALLRSLLPPLRRLMPQPGRDTQAAAAEVLGGLVRGAGCWGLSSQQELWRALDEPLGTALRACSVESLSDWQEMIRFVAYNRDPRRLQWLARLLLQLEPADATSATSLALAKYLRFLAPLLVELGWRGVPLLRQLLQGEGLSRWISHPYKQVREEAGTVLALAMHAASPTSQNHPHLSAELGSAIETFLEHLVSSCRASLVGHDELEPEGEEERTQARGARECLLSCLRHCLKLARPQACAAHLPECIGAIMTTAASTQPPDLSTFAKKVAVLLVQAPLAPEVQARFFGELGVLARSASWHLRGCTLLPLNLLAYIGQYAPCAQKDLARELLLGLLQDPQQEVREAVVPVLSGFVRIHGALERQQLLEWAQKRLRRGSALVERHAGALALESLVQLAPYEIPQWLPEVLERLAALANEGQPIKRGVQRAFTDFRRTHQDNWSEHKLRLSPEQQDLFADVVVAPSFYA